MAEPSQVEGRHRRASDLLVVAGKAGSTRSLSRGYLAVDRATYSSGWVRQGRGSAQSLTGNEMMSLKEMAHRVEAFNDPAFR